MQAIRLGHIEDIPDGEARGFDPLASGRDSVFIVRRGDALHAWFDRCPHEGATPLPLRRHHYLNARRTRIVCFAHGAQFDIASGRCVLGVCVGEALSAAAVDVSETGEIWLRNDGKMAGDQDH